MMYEQINKIYKGMLFMLFDLNFVVDLVADSIGVLLIASACKGLYDMYGDKTFKKAYVLMIILLPFAGVNDLYLLAQTHQMIGYSYTLANGILFSLSLVYLLIGLTPYIENFSYGKVKLFIVLNLLMTFLVTFSEYVQNTDLMALLIVIGLFTLLSDILVILEVRLLKKQYET